MQNITPGQRKRLEELQAADPQLTYRWDEARGVAAFVRGKLATQARAQMVLESSLADFLTKYGDLFGPPGLEGSLARLRDRKDALGWRHIEFQYFHPVRGFLWSRRVEVYKSRVAVHIDPEGVLTEVQSSCWREIQLDARVRVSPRGLRKILDRLIRDKPGYHELKRGQSTRDARTFPVMLPPQLVIHPWRGSFRMAYITHAYGLRSDDAARIELGEVFVDARTAELFVFAPTRRDVDTPDVGAGQSVTPLGGPFTAHGLHIARVDFSATYKLRDMTHAREVHTFDLAADPAFNSQFEIKNGIHNGTLPFSLNNGKLWNRLPVDDSAAERTASQQPEVDAHFHGNAAYEWYNALAGGSGRAGWDDNQYDNPPVPPQPVRALVHILTSYGNDAYADHETVDGLYYFWLVFGDGDLSATCNTPGDRALSYLAGSKLIFGHEYQHAITDFSFTTSLGRPGLSYSGWLKAVHEGLSDAFGCMFAGHWHMGTKIAPTGLGLRNLAYPRDPNTRHNLPYSGIICGGGYSAKDHFGDRDPVASEYDRGTILGHGAYLMAQGGVHQRAVRTPVLIPVSGLGHETSLGIQVFKAARIWYRALTWYFSTHGALTDTPVNDESAFRTLRDGCESAAIDLYGAGSREHRTTVLAFYAIGLHTPATTYGADVTFLPWGWSWHLSRPHLGGILASSPDWSSLDLFINNGGISEWNALINEETPSGPTEFENNLYCRVRNVGDLPALDVQVTFEYAKAGMGSTTWLPVTDRHGTPQVLHIGTLGAGDSNFPESQQDTPPAAAGVKWHIPPLAPGELVDHFCLRATVSSSNDVNPHNNTVQSNIAYAPYTPMTPFTLILVAGNPFRVEIPLELEIASALPEGWKVKIPADTGNVTLPPGEERLFPLEIHMAPGADEVLEPPFDGRLRGELFGPLSGPFEGALSESIWDGKHLRGRLSAALEEVGQLTGTFEGTLDTATGEVTGRLIGIWNCAARKDDVRLCAGLKGCLRPLRRVDVRQLADGRPFGGVTVQVQVPMVKGPCAYDLPPADTWVTAGK